MTTTRTHGRTHRSSEQLRIVTSPACAEPVLSLTFVALGASPMCYRLLIFLIVVSFTGCAEYLGNSRRIATINLQVPSHSREAVAADTERVTQLVGNIAEQHGLARQPTRPLFGRSFVVGVPGYSGGAWPGQPDVDWDAGRCWEIRIPRRDGIPDRVRCTVFPPLTGNVLKVDLDTHYASRMPPIAKALWADLLASLTHTFGRDAILKIEDLK